MLSQEACEVTAELRASFSELAMEVRSELAMEVRKQQDQLKVNSVRLAPRIPSFSPPSKKMEKKSIKCLQREDRNSELWFA